MGNVEEQHVVTLSPGQFRIFDEFMKKGETNGQIAIKLYVTEDTVKTHMKNIMRKAGVKTRTELAVGVARKRIIVKRGTSHEWRVR